MQVLKSIRLVFLSAVRISLVRCPYIFTKRVCCWELQVFFFNFVQSILMSGVLSRSSCNLFLFNLPVSLQWQVLFGYVGNRLKAVVKFDISIREPSSYHKTMCHNLGTWPRSATDRAHRLAPSLDKLTFRQRQPNQMSQSRMTLPRPGYRTVLIPSWSDICQNLVSLCISLSPSPFLHCQPVG